jgi:hypothetical protein
VSGCIIGYQYSAARSLGMPFLLSMACYFLLIGGVPIAGLCNSMRKA